jgi:small subunit ribosomal protein S27e
MADSAGGTMRRIQKSKSIFFEVDGKPIFFDQSMIFPPGHPFHSPSSHSSFPPPSSFFALPSRTLRLHVKMVQDLLFPTEVSEARKHKLKRLVQGPNSFFMDVKCAGCFTITTVFSHAQSVVLCGSCSQMLCQPTGGKARLTEGCSFRKKQD